MGSYSVGGGKKIYTSLRESKGSSVKRGPSYGKSSTTKTSTGVAQFSTSPIKDTPKQIEQVKPMDFKVPDLGEHKPRVAKQNTNTKPTTIKPVSISEKTAKTIKSRAQLLKDSLDY